MTGGQFIMSRLKAFEGAIALVPDEFDGYFASPEFPTFSLREGVGESRYVKHLFGWSVFWDMLKGESQGIGARRERVSAERLLALQVPLPQVNEQRRIAEKLDATLGDIARLGQLKKESDTLVRQHADSLFSSIVEQRPLSSVLNESSDFVAVSPEKTYRTAGILNRGRGLFHRPVISGNETKYPRYNQLKSQQFVYSKLFGWEGSLAVVPADFHGIHVSHEFPTFDIDEEVADVSYMTHLARWDGLHHRLKDQGSGMGSRRQRVNVSRLLATEVPLPSLPEQRSIAERLTLARGVAEAGARQVADLETLRKELLDAALSGRL